MRNLIFKVFGGEGGCGYYKVKDECYHHVGFYLGRFLLAWDVRKKKFSYCNFFATGVG